VEMARVGELARAAMEELRAVVFELRPGSLEAEGLATVLRKHVDVLRRVSGRRIELRVGEVPRLEPGPATQVLRIAQEALGNALRHAEASVIRVLLDARRLRVEDDGCGFDPDAARGKRLGLTSMRERATELGGTLTVTSDDGGTVVELVMPK